MKMGKNKDKNKMVEKPNSIIVENIDKQEKELVFQMSVINDSFVFWGERLQNLMAKLSQIPDNWQNEEKRGKVENDIRMVLFRLERIENPIAEKIQKKIDYFNEKKAKNLFTGLANKLLNKEKKS